MTSLRFALPALALLAAVSCRPAPETNAVAEDDSAARAAAEAPAADINESLALDQLAGAQNHMAAPVGYGGIPPADRALRFVGRWASAEPLCRGETWRFSPDSLETPGEQACTFNDIAPVEGGYDITAQCTAEGRTRAETIRLRFAESARAMLVEGEGFAGTGLIYCGPVEGD